MDLSGPQVHIYSNQTTWLLVKSPSPAEPENTAVTEGFFAFNGIDRQQLIIKKLSIHLQETRSWATLIWQPWREEWLQSDNSWANEQMRGSCERRSRVGELRENWRGTENCQRSYRKHRKMMNWKQEPTGNPDRPEYSNRNKIWYKLHTFQQL